MKVQQFYNLNQFIIWGDDKIILQSYNSTIAIYKVKEKELTLGSDWDYSRTTLKHLYLFLYDHVHLFDDEGCDIGFNLHYNRVNSKKGYIEKLLKKGVIKHDKSL